MKIVYFLILFFITSLTLPAQEKLEFIDVPTVAVFRPLIKEIYKPLGFDIEFLDMPPARGTRMVNSGLNDGYTLAYPVLLEVAPDLILIPEFIFKEPVAAYVKSGTTIQVRGWNSIRSYSVGIVRGHKLVEINTKNFEDITVVNTPEMLFRMLESNRIDVAVFYPSIAHLVLQDLGFDDIIALDPPLMLLPLHTFLHKKHAGLVPLVADRIREMKESGRMDEILDQLLQR